MQVPDTPRIRTKSFMSKFEEQYEENKIIDQIKDQISIPKEVRKSMIDEIRKSFAQNRQNSSMATIFSIVNTMVGSSIIVFPLQFQKSGIITSLIAMFVIGLVSCKTALLQLKHFKIDEQDLPDIIKRLLGKKWFYVFNVGSVLLLYIAGVIYYILSSGILYDFLVFLFKKFGVTITSDKSIHFDQFSYQYMGIILIFFEYFIFSLKKLDFIIKLGKFGIGAVLIFIIYVLIQSFITIGNGEVSSSGQNSLNLFSSDIGEIAGVFALSFFIHSLLLPIIKQNKNYDNNSRDLGLAYGMTGLIYGVVGVFGSIAIVNQGSLVEARNFFSYYQQQWINNLISFLIFLQLTSVIPIIVYCTRNQFFNIFYSASQPPQWQTIAFNISFTIAAFICQVFNVSPSLIMSINGAICGFVLIYLIPIKLHLTCLYSDDSVDGQLLDEYQDIQDETSNRQVPHINSTYQNSQINQRQIQLKQKREKTCTSSHHLMMESNSKITRYIFYGFLIAIGAAIAGLLLKDIISPSNK